MYEEYLCSSCYHTVHPAKVKKAKKRAEPQPMKHSGYFEATIQLRNVSPDITDFVFERIEQHDIKISKKTLLSNGVDIMIDDSGFAKKLGKALQQKFGGMVKTTARIFTRDRATSKDIYRTTLLFKQFQYKKGEEFFFKGKAYAVVNASTDVFAEDVQTKERKRLRFRELEKARLF